MLLDTKFEKYYFLVKEKLTQQKFTFPWNEADEKKNCYFYNTYIGGTNFGFMNGGNHDDGYQPTITSYGMYILSNAA